LLKHFVFFRYRPDTPREHIDAFSDKMRALTGKIPEIEALEIGRDEFGEERSWSLMLSMTFRSVEALRRYQTHAEHVAVMRFNDPYVTDVGSVDHHCQQ
jgi:hypothetical protein